MKGGGRRDGDGYGYWGREKGDGAGMGIGKGPACDGHERGRKRYEMLYWVG